MPEPETAAKRPAPETATKRPEPATASKRPEPATASKRPEPATASKRRGRPPATDSEDTRDAVIDAARLEFAEKGYDGTSLSAIAAAVALSPSALYHYYDGKESLYEAVMLRTVEYVWSGLLDRVLAESSLERQVEQFLAGADRYGSDERLFSAFLIGVPVEARRYPAFAPLAELLGTWQSRVFDAMAETGLTSGALVGFGSVADAGQALRMLLLGWSFETHYRPELRRKRADAVRRAVAAWSAGG